MLGSIQGILMQSDQSSSFVILRTYQWVELDDVVRMPVVRLEDNHLVVPGTVSSSACRSILD